MENALPVEALSENKNAGVDFLKRTSSQILNAIKVLDVNRPNSEYDGLDPLIFALRTQWLIH